MVDHERGDHEGHQPGRQVASPITKNISKHDFGLR